jgi:hypothetical protein
VVPLIISSLNVRRSGERGASLKMEVGPKSSSSFFWLSYRHENSSGQSKTGGEREENTAYMEVLCGGDNVVDVDVLWFCLCKHWLRLN